MRKYLLLALYLIVAVKAVAEDQPPSYSLVLGITGNQLDSSKFPVESAYGFHSSQKTVGLTVDGQSAGFVWRIRAQSQLNDGKHQSNELRVKELSRVWSITDHCTVAAGKRILSWDVGYLAQPVGFFQNLPTLNDLNDLAGVSEGLPMVVAGCGTSSGFAIDLVYSEDLQKISPYMPGLRQTVLRLSGPIGKSTASVLLRHVESGEDGIGGTVSSTIGKTLELHGSLYAARGRIQSRARAFYGSSRQTAYVQSVNNNFSTKALLGATWTPSDNWTFNLEFTHDDAGLGADEWRDWLALVRAHQALPSSKAKTGALLSDLQTISSNGTRRDYAYVQASTRIKGYPMSLGITSGLNDRSAGIFLATSRNIGRHSSLSLSLSHFAGTGVQEYAFLPYRNTAYIAFSTNYY